MTSLTIVVIIICLFVTITSGQLGDGLPQCTDNINTNVQQVGDFRLRRRVQVVVTSANFTCDGRLNRIMASMLQQSGNSGTFLFQVWRSSFPGSDIYNRVGQIALRESDITEVNVGINMTYWLLNMSLTGDERIEFQAGDIIGYYHSVNPRYRVHNNPNPANYRQTYSINNETGPTETFDLNDTDIVPHNRQPLFSVNYDVPCYNLSAPTNGEITSCSSGRVEVGYEGDTCSFTCNTGYELTGSDTRTCQSDGSWSGNDVICRELGTTPSPVSSDPQGTSLIIGAIIGGILLLTIIVLLLIIISLLYRNKRSKGRLDINSASVAYKAAAGADLSSNVIINPNPSYNPVKRESNIYSSSGMEPTYHEIGEKSMIIKNPTFSSNDNNPTMFSSNDNNNDYDYVVNAEELLASVN